MQIAAKRNSVELLSLFNKYAMNPPSMTIKLLTLIIESDRSLDAFKKQLQSLPASEVISCPHVLCYIEPVTSNLTGNDLLAEAKIYYKRFVYTGNFSNSRNF